MRCSAMNNPLRKDIYLMRGPLSSKECDDVKISVVEMFEDCEVDSIPICPFTIAKKQYIVCRPYSELSAEKQMWAFSISSDAFSQVERDPLTNRNQYVIYYNDIDRDIARIRWSIFHELGHIARGHHDNHDDNLYDIEEAEANLFAKYAIAPPPLIHVLRIQSWQEIVSVFHTSEDAARNCYNYYLKWLNNGPEDYTDFELRLLELFHLSAA